MTMRTGLRLVSLAIGVLWMGAGMVNAQKTDKQPADVTDRQLAELKTLCMEPNPNASAQIKVALKDTNAMVRRMAIYALERLRDPSAVPDIAAMLHDEDAWVRRTAAVALGKVGGNDGAPALAATAGSDEQILVRFDALLALARLRDAGTQSQVFTAMQNPRLWSELYGSEQAQLVEMLAADWITDPGVRPFLQSLLKKTISQPDALDAERKKTAERQIQIVQEAAAAALAMRFADAGGEDMLIAAATRRDDDLLLQKATCALGAIKSRKAMPALTTALTDGNARKEKWLNTSRLIIGALGDIGGPEAIAALENTLKHEDYRMRKAAADALKKIDGRTSEIAPEGPIATIPPMPDGALPTPGGKRPPQFIILGVDDCTNIEGLETLLDMCQSLRDGKSKAVFTLWLAPLAGSSINNDIEKRKVLYQKLFDMGCEIAHHTLHHNPGGRNWASLSHEIQIEEIEGCTQWYRDNIQGFTRPFTHKGGGGGHGSAADRQFTQDLLARQNFIYRGQRGGHPAEFIWPARDVVPMIIPCQGLDAGAGTSQVHAKFTDPIYSDYPGRFDYEIADGVAMWKANFDYRYAHPLRPPLVINAFHDWGLRDVIDTTQTGSLRNEGKILKAFLLDVLVTNKDKYPDTYCITFRQFMEYVRTDGDLQQTLNIGNGQDSRNPVKPSIE